MCYLKIYLFLHIIVKLILQYLIFSHNTIFMKNKTNLFISSKSTMLLMLLLLLCLGTQSFAQSAKTKTVVPTKAVLSTNNVISSEARSLDPTAEADKMRGDNPINPEGYTATKVSVSESAAPEIKADFIKKHGADHYYMYLDNNGKTVDQQQYNEAVRIETEKQSKNKLNSNPKQ